MSATDVFFVTNLLLYLLAEDAAKADPAEALLASSGVVSVQVLNEFASVATGKLALTVAEVREVLATIRAVCIVKPVDVETHELGLDLTEPYRFSVYDSLILAAALRAGREVLYTEDRRHRQRIGHLTIQNPFAGR